ncbi:MAG: hypothetical protein MJ231_08005 [bacterium]|nr:hypothetical protein [bacterium]
MYINILAEMTRKQLDKYRMAELMSISPEEFESKLNHKSKLTVKDVFKMQRIFNENYCTFEYLLEDQFRRLMMKEY